MEATVSPKTLITTHQITHHDLQDHNGNTSKMILYVQYILFYFNPQTWWNANINFPYKFSVFPAYYSSFIQYSVWRQVQSLLQNDASI